MMRKAQVTLGLLGVIGSIIAGVAIGVGGAMVWTNDAITQAVQPVAEQSTADHQAILGQTALLVVIAEKDGIPATEVNQLLNTNGQ